MLAHATHNRELLNGKDIFRSHQLNTPAINNWQGLSFERICMCHIENIKKALGISAIAAEYFSWRSEESKPAAQIGLLIERAGRVVNVCEMKYCSGEYALKMVQTSELGQTRIIRTSERLTVS